MVASLLRLALVIAILCALLVAGALTAANAALPADEIAFDAEIAYRREIFLLDAGRGLLVRLTFSGGRSAAWSPDGQQIAFIGPAGAEDGEGLYVMTPGSRPRLLREVQKVQGETRALDWSPDGQQIAYTDNRNGVQQLYLLDLAANTTRPITDERGSAFAPAWSPPGLIAFSWSPVANAEIYTLPAADSVAQPWRITDNPYTDSAPEWSPDGQWLAFVSDRAGSSNIYLMRPDGADLRPVLLTASADHDPTWSPDGMRLAITSTAGRVSQLLIVDLRSGSLQPLLNLPDQTPARPAWRP